MTQNAMIQIDLDHGDPAFQFAHFNPQLQKVAMAHTLSVGDRVQLVALPPYLKTADPMPMLRPADLLQVGDEGLVLDRRPSGYWGVRFERGAFLMDASYLAPVTAFNR